MYAASLCVHASTDWAIGLLGAYRKIWPWYKWFTYWTCERVCVQHTSCLDMHICNNRIFLWYFEASRPCLRPYLIILPCFFPRQYSFHCFKICRFSLQIDVLEITLFLHIHAIVWIYDASVCPVCIFIWTYAHILSLCAVLIWNITLRRYIYIYIYNIGHLDVV